MSIFDKAAEVIRTWQQRHKTEMDNNTDWAARNLAGDLHRAGLLVGDLPDVAGEYEYPDIEGVFHSWKAQGVFVFVELSPQHQIKIKYMRESHTPEEARSIALALLAAANHAEEE